MFSKLTKQDHHDTKVTLWEIGSAQKKNPILAWNSSQGGYLDKWPVYALYSVAKGGVTKINMQAEGSHRTAFQLVPLDLIKCQRKWAFFKSMSLWMVNVLAPGTLQNQDFISHFCTAPQNWFSMLPKLFLSFPAPWRIFWLPSNSFLYSLLLRHFPLLPSP